jgi:hypothetical protein
VKCTPSIKRPEQVLRAKVEQLQTFLRKNTTPKDQLMLGRSQMRKPELRRHCFVLAGGQITSTIQRLVSPYMRLEKDGLSDGCCGDCFCPRCRGDA